MFGFKLEAHCVAGIKAATTEFLYPHLVSFFPRHGPGCQGSLSCEEGVGLLDWAPHVPTPWNLELFHETRLLL